MEALLKQRTELETLIRAISASKHGHVGTRGWWRPGLQRGLEHAGGGPSRGSGGLLLAAADVGRRGGAESGCRALSSAGEAVATGAEGNGAEARPGGAVMWTGQGRSNWGVPANLDQERGRISSLSVDPIGKFRAIWTGQWFYRF